MKTFRELRKELGFTQAGVAKALGVNIATVGRWEASDAPQHALLAMEALAMRSRRLEVSERIGEAQKSLQAIREQIEGKETE